MENQFWVDSCRVIDNIFIMKLNFSWRLLRVAFFGMGRVKAVAWAKPSLTIALKYFNLSQDDTAKNDASVRLGILKSLAT